MSLRLERVLSAVYGNAWAILPDTLDIVMQICLRQGEGPEAVSARLGRPLENTRNVFVQDGVAVIPVTGPIVPRGNQMDVISGATSLHMLARDLQAAVQDDSVRAIMLDIDSPGGVASGIGEFAEDVRAANAIKPVTAYVSGYAASAAYWIASAAGEIVAHKTASLGSIGVVTARYVQEEPDANGYREYEIVSSNAGNKRPDPRTDEGHAEIVRHINSLEDQFIADVAENRKVSAEKVRQDFGRGGILIAAEAIKAGMADRLGSYEDTLATLSQRKPKGAKIMTQTKTGADGAPAVTAESIRQNHPDIAATIEKTGHDAGFKAGAEAERARISAIDEISRPGFEAMIAEARADGKSTAGDVAIAMAKQEKANGGNNLAKIKAEAADAPVIKPAAQTDQKDDGPGPDASIEDRAKYGWTKMDEKAKAGFGNKFDIYLGSLKAEEKGFGRVKSSRN